MYMTSKPNEFLKKKIGNTQNFWTKSSMFFGSKELIKKKKSAVLTGFIVLIS